MFFRKKLLFILFQAFVFTNIVFSQINHRIEAEISIKEITNAGEQSLMMGKVFYDKNIREIVYEISFPKQNRFAITDNGILPNQTDSIDLTGKTKQLVDFSVVNLFLNQELGYFGLENTPFTMLSVEREGDMVISEWQLPEEMGQNMGKMLISQKNKQLFGLVTLGPDDVLVSKQFFSEYIDVNGYMFPSKIIQINYSLLGESKKITTFRNIKLNNYANENSYHF
jgi:hypothetical protein